MLGRCVPAVDAAPPSPGALQGELDNGAAVAALRRFNDLLANLPADSWGEGGGGGGGEGNREARAVRAVSLSAGSTTTRG